MSPRIRIAPSSKVDRHEPAEVEGRRGGGRERRAHRHGSPPGSPSLVAHLIEPRDLGEDLEGIVSVGGLHGGGPPPVADSFGEGHLRHRVKPPGSLP
jgi:hypothetical protein